MCTHLHNVIPILRVFFSNKWNFILNAALNRRLSQVDFERGGSGVFALESINDNIRGVPYKYLLSALSEVQFVQYNCSFL
jgi:hypothetical protein